MAEMQYWDDWSQWSDGVIVPAPLLICKSGGVVGRFVNSWGNWPPETAIATGEADDDPFRRLAAQIRGPGERLVRQVLQR